MQETRYGVIISFAIAVVVATLALWFAANSFPETAVGQTQEVWNYVALGDSITIGSYDLNSVGFVGRWATHAEADNPNVDVLVNKSHAQGGTGSGQQKAIIDMADTQRSLKGAEVVSFETGAADYISARQVYKSRACGGTDNQDCLRNKLYNPSGTAVFQKNYEYILDRIAEHAPGSERLVMPMIGFNFAKSLDSGVQSNTNDGGVDDFGVLNEYLKNMNLWAAEEAEERGMSFFDMQLSLNGPSREEDSYAAGYHAKYDVHPSPKGHTKLSSDMRLLGYDPIG